MTLSINFRPPPSTGHLQADFSPPTIDWVSGTWHLTHSSLSVWKNSRNVTMNYRIIPVSGAQEPSTKFDDTTSYQTLTSSRIKSINGVSTARGADTSVWDWRGKGWLKIATSHWEILGYGDIAEEDGGPGQWFVTYFAATTFSSAGIGIYSRTKEGNPEAVLKDILKKLGEIEDEAIKKLAGEIVEVVRS